jgi:hypothetical protein
VHWNFVVLLFPIQGRPRTFITRLSDRRKVTGEWFIPSESSGRMPIAWNYCSGHRASMHLFCMDSHSFWPGHQRNVANDCQDRGLLQVRLEIGIGQAEGAGSTVASIMGCHHEARWSSLSATEPLPEPVDHRSQKPRFISI